MLTLALVSTGPDTAAPAGSSRGQPALGARAEDSDRQPAVAAGVGREHASPARVGDDRDPAASRQRLTGQQRGGVD